MPSTFVFAIASASAAAATTNAIVSFRRGQSMRKLVRPAGGGGGGRGRKSSSVRVSAASCPEIEALKVKPGWHPDGSPEERVKQLGLELDGRVATNPAGTARSVSMNLCSTHTPNNNNFFIFFLAKRACVPFFFIFFALHPSINLSFKPPFFRAAVVVEPQICDAIPQCVDLIASYERTCENDAQTRLDPHAQVSSTPRCWWATWRTSAARRGLITASS